MKKLFYIPVLAAVLFLISGCKTDVGNTITTPAHPNFVITLDSNNGSNEKTSQTGEYGATITLNLNTFIYAGHDFNGWSTKKNPNVRSADFYNDGDSFHIVSNQTLYARWKAHDCVIRFHFNASGTNLGSEMADYSFCSDSNVKIPLSKFALDEKGFRGWTTSPASTEVVYKDGESIPANTFTKSEEGMNYVDLYAIWETPDYWVTFYPNGGTGIAVKQGFFSGEEQNLMPCIFTKTDYVLKGWSTSSGVGIDGNITYSPEEVLSVSSDKSLYAVWKRAVTVLKYSANGGKGTQPDDTFFYSSGITLMSNPFSREHYTFIGWNTKADGSGYTYSAGSKMILSEYTDEITLYAQWKVREYNITILDSKPDDEYSGKGTSSITVPYGTTVTIPECGFTLTHYNFLGWNTEYDHKGQTYKPNDKITIDNDMYLYGMWEGKTYTITLCDNRSKYQTTGYGDNLEDVIYTQTYKYGEYVTLKQPDSKEFTDHFSSYNNGYKVSSIVAYYDFDGWAETNSLTGTKVSSYTSCKKCNFTLYGLWHMRNPLVIIEKNHPGINSKNIDIVPSSELGGSGLSRTISGQDYQFADSGTYKHIGFSDTSKDGWAQYKISKTGNVNLNNISSKVVSGSYFKKPIILYAVWFKFDSVSFTAISDYKYNDTDTSKKTNVSKFAMDKYELTEINYYKVMGGTKPATANEQKPHKFNSPSGAINFIIELNKAFKPKYYTASSETADNTNTASTAYFGTSGKDLSSLSSSNFLKCNRGVKGFRLPDPAEWCVAAKSGSNTYPYGASSIDNVAWTADNSNRSINVVGTKAKNSKGLYDMFGNVDEIVHMYNKNEQNSDTVAGGSSIYLRVIGGCYNELATAIQNGIKRGTGDYYDLFKSNSSHAFGLRLVFDGN